MGNCYFLQKLEEGFLEVTGLPFFQAQMPRMACHRKVTLAGASSASVWKLDCLLPFCDPTWEVKEVNYVIYNENI